MSRRKLSKKRIFKKDPFYNNELIQIIINRIMKKGNKALARKIIYRSLKDIELVTKQDPIKIVEQAVSNVTPFVEIRSRRLGGSTTQIPVFINNERGVTLAIRWLFQASKNKAGNKYSIIKRLSSEIVNASNGMGEAIKKRDEMHRMAEANKTIVKYNVL
ncbi:30S ribosomal protein S7 (plastid) [Bigelowiella natans]|uniref:Small ribosomal subunit protein uS7c n=1 Tax=Bigelowiella natans TaxID=227086 RepID=RR7_BIGNA|nr:30S ribosomal protein S7 [Bigelowiella natans]Q06J33.1 RecName: Full=Small ribosomal subunit protein uS7c; AltName: Full=30S ribosomal protein S7, chloroplastic [Bigelowiella natans]ABG91426.1 30S ribosomal protein S7 [Bigelowiella natans]